MFCHHPHNNILPTHHVVLIVRLSRGEKKTQKPNIRTDPNRKFEIQFDLFGFSVRFGFRILKISVSRSDSVRTIKKLKNRILF